MVKKFMWKKFLKKFVWYVPLPLILGAILTVIYPKSQNIYASFAVSVLMGIVAEIAIWYIWFSWEFLFEDYYEER